MRETLKTEQVAVLDDVLAPAELLELWKYLQLDTYVETSAVSWRKAWWLSDGRVLHGTTHYSERPENVPGLSGLFYPSGFAMDLLMAAVAARADALAPLIGERGRDWSVFSARPYLYPAGSGLAWHQDGAYSGAFIFYAHPEWDPSWGGELLLADPSCTGWEPPLVPVRGVAEPQRIPVSLDHREQSAMLLREGHGRFIMPKPNRLVVLQAHTFHTLLPVRPSAGDRARCSVSGFFQHVVPL